MKRLSFLLAAFLLVGSVFAQNAPTTKLISSSEDRIVVNFQLNGFNTAKVQTPQGEQFIVNVPGMVAMLEAGAPELPTYPIRTIIGDRAEMTVNVIDAQYTDYNLSVAPSKGNLSRQVNPDDVPYTYGEMYQQDAFWPATQAVLNAPYILRDFRGQNIMVSPFAYNPVSQTLRVYTDLTIEMTKVSDNGENPKEPRRSSTIKVDPEQKAIYGHRFINFGESCAKYTFDEDFGEMLVICTDRYMPNLQPLVDWKNQSGRPTTMVSLTEAGGNNIENIKNYVSNFYNDPDHNLEFLLLVGEFNDLTPKNYGSGSGGTCYSDNYLGKLEGNDDYLEVLVGRFSVQDAADADVQVNKTIYYERDVQAGAAWGNRGVGIGSTLEGSGGHFGEYDATHIDLIRDTLLHYTYDVVTDLHQGGSGSANASVASISAAINAGTSIINYCNHGDVTLWGVASYSTSNVAALTNDGMLPVVWSVACLNGKFDYGTCFAESWLRAKNNSTGAPTGAIAGMFSYVSQPWQPPMYGQDEMNDILTEWRSVDQFNHTIGGASLNGSMYVRDIAPNDAYQTFNTWLLFGDPSAMFRTDIPAEMNVTASPNVLMLGMTELQVSVDADYAIATLSMDGEVLASGRVENGECNLSFAPISNVGNAQLVIMGYNKATYIGEIEVVPAEGAYMTVSTYAMSAEQANYGETVDLSIDVKNVGVEVASNMTATLTTENEYVEILAGEATIAEVNPDETVTVEGFQFHVAENVPDGTVAQFFLNITDGTNEWDGKINITLHAPVLALQGIVTTDTDVTIGVVNTGSAPFYGGTLILTSCSNELVFEPETIVSEETIAGGEALTMTSNYTVAPTVAPASSFEVSYNFTSGDFVEEGIFTIDYQVLQETFESGAFGEGWTFSQANAWTIVNGGTKGTKCAKSMNNGIANSDYWMTLTVEVAAAGELTFDYKVSSEASWDKIHFYMDGQQIFEDSGNKDWTTYTQTVTVGSHTFKWSYTKDSSVNSGDDCAMVDNIVFPIVNQYIFLAPATNLQAEVEGANVALRWEGPADAENYVIKRDGETLATITETTYNDVLPSDGTYTYAVYVANSEGQLSTPVTVTVVAEFDAVIENPNARVSVYPNPANDVLNIVVESSNFTYELINSLGQVVRSGNATNKGILRVSDLNNGVYFLRVSNGAQVNIQKIVVE